jgi:hypothetical protein
MSLLCDLPEILVDRLLLSWVKVKDVGRLDSSVCNKSLRPTFLSLVSRDQFVFELPSFHVTRDLPFLSWTMRRCIAVVELVISTSFTNHTDKRLKYLQHHGGHIRKVTLRRGAGTSRNCKAAMNDICVHCPSLTEFECRMPLSTAMHAIIATNWTNLTHLTLIQYVIVDGFVSIGKSCQSLTHLCVWAVWAPQIEMFFRVCSPKLLSVTMSACAAWTPSDYVAIALRCHMLREIDVFTTYMNDAALIALGSGCPLLSALDLMYNRAVTDAGLIAFALNGALTTLDVTACDHITDEGLRAAAQFSPRLQSICIRRCVVSDATLIALGQHCHDLRYLTVDQCDIHREGLQAIARGCPSLRTVAAPAADVPAAAVLALAECCPLLEEVNLTGKDQCAGARLSSAEEAHDNGYVRHCRRSARRLRALQDAQSA